MEPNYTRAASLALITLNTNHITATPVSPLPILKNIPGVLVLSFESVAGELGMDRRCVMDMFGEKNQDAFTSVSIADGKTRYLVTYNQHLPSNLVQRALARELGHIILGHDGSLPEDIRNDEARCFAHHLLVPRPLIHSLQASGLRITVEALGSITGCYDYCLSCMRKQPPVHVDPMLNRAVRDQFMPYIHNYFEFQRYASHHDTSAIADFGSYMEGYEE